MFRFWRSAPTMKSFARRTAVQAGPVAQHFPEGAKANAKYAQTHQRRRMSQSKSAGLGKPGLFSVSTAQSQLPQQPRRWSIERSSCASRICPTNSAARVPAAGRAVTVRTLSAARRILPNIRMNTTPIDRRRTLALLGGAAAGTLFFPSRNSAQQPALTCGNSTPQVTIGPYFVEEKLLRGRGPLSDQYRRADRPLRRRSPPCRVSRRHRQPIRRADQGVRFLRNRTALLRVALRGLAACPRTNSMAPSRSAIAGNMRSRAWIACPMATFRHSSVSY